LIKNGMVSAVHDCSDGGLFVAIAEMALAGGIGARLERLTQEVLQSIPADHAYAFGEEQGRYVMTGPVGLAESFWIGPIRKIGVTGGDRISFPGMADVTLDDLRHAHEGFFPNLMGADAALA
jgi:phosphoribosylformylglycinamidine synthase